MNAENLQNGLVLVAALSSLTDQLVKVRDLMAKEGGATNSDIQGLFDFFSSERARVQAIIDAMPEQKIPLNTTD